MILPKPRNYLVCDSTCPNNLAFSGFKLATSWVGWKILVGRESKVARITIYIYISLLCQWQLKCLLQMSEQWGTWHWPAPTGGFERDWIESAANHCCARIQRCFTRIQIRFTRLRQRGTESAADGCFARVWQWFTRVRLWFARVRHCLPFVPVVLLCIFSFTTVSGPAEVILSWSGLRCKGIWRAKRAGKCFPGHAHLYWTTPTTHRILVRTWISKSCRQNT